MLPDQSVVINKNNKKIYIYAHTIIYFLIYGCLSVRPPRCQLCAVLACVMFICIQLALSLPTGQFIIGQRKSDNYKFWSHLMRPTNRGAAFYECICVCVSLGHIV